MATNRIAHESRSRADAMIARAQSGRMVWHRDTNPRIFGAKACWTESHLIGTDGRVYPWGYANHVAAAGVPV